MKKLVLSIVATILLSAMHSAHARDQVCFYQHTNYKGKEACFSGSRAASTDLRRLTHDSINWNDTISSVRIWGARSVTLCEHIDIEGRCVSLTSSRSKLGSFNDKASSFYVGTQVSLRRSDTLDGDLIVGGGSGKGAQVYLERHGEVRGRSSGQFKIDIPAGLLNCVTDAFQHVLGRAPSQKEINWHSEKSNPCSTGFRHGIARSQESKNNVRAAFQKYLCRKASESDVNWQINDVMIKRGYSIGQLRSSIRRSKEAKSKRGSCR